MSISIGRDSSGGFSPLRGLLMFVGAGVVAAGSWFGLGSMRNWATEPTSAPNCYWADEAYVPQNQTMPLMGAPDRNGVPNNRRRMGTSDIEKVLAAEKVCTPGACTQDAAKAYRSAFFWYIEPRLQHIRQLDMAYGDNGLRLARTIYSDALDLQLEKGLRERYQAKAFRINDSRQNRDAMAILIFKGGSALRSCRRADL
ncbi:MAG: hypothetical protein QOF91_2868 [Alphaproteobacteria bacterium]|jgi:hypothetical protein|nr:hypothetical protein [Alphaproteobacteria bacterium]MEA3027583.1 hypothetical protein [Alphaproteobacteria bacterium]